MQRTKAQDEAWRRMVAHVPDTTRAIDLDWHQITRKELRKAA